MVAFSFKGGLKISGALQGRWVSHITRAAVALPIPCQWLDYLCMPVEMFGIRAKCNQVGIHVIQSLSRKLTFSFDVLRILN